MSVTRRHESLLRLFTNGWLDRLTLGRDAPVGRDHSGIKESSVIDEGTPNPEPTPLPGQTFMFERKVVGLKRRVVKEATQAISMLERALDALWRLDAEAAREVRRSDDSIDHEEVQIEQECFAMLTLHHAFARDFRVVTFVLKVNQDIERVADHASSIAKIVPKLEHDGTVVWPTALLELGQRVPLRCHGLLRAVLDEDVEAARRLVVEDKTIDNLDAKLFGETIEHMQQHGSTHAAMTNGLLMYRIGRELERVGDLMTNIAEDVIYLATGEIIRHTYKERRRKTGS